MTHVATEASRYLVALAGRIAEAYIGETEPRAMLLTGSAAAGDSDYFSDLDLIAYYERRPTVDQLAAARARIGATNSRVSAGSDEEASIIEEFALHGVECQLGHCAIASWERDLASVLDGCTPATLAEKAIMGLRAGIALHGNDLIEQWKERAAHYPEGLARATIERHLRFFPLWLLDEGWWNSRDASIFYHQMLVETSLNLLAVLAGLNHLYFSTFQVKRLHRIAGTMHVAPKHLADRLDELFTLDPGGAGAALERLVEETITLVETHMPEVDTIPARRTIGVRHRPWSGQTA